MANQIDDGIEIYIKHVRRMSLLTDEQIRIMISHIYSQDPSSVEIAGINIDDYISKIRQMSLLSDTQLRTSLKDAAAKDPALREVFEDSAQKKLFSEMKNMAEDVKSDPRKLARKVDRL